MTKDETSSAHTAAPWIFGESVTSELRFSVTAKIGKTQFPFTILETGNEASARLIAAAPDLLEACKAALTEGDDYKAQEMLKAAIRKAEGTPEYCPCGKELTDENGIRYSPACK